MPLLLLLLGSSFIFPLLCLFFILFFYLVLSCRLCCCASTPSSSASLSFAHSSVLSLPLFGSAGGGLAPAQWPCYLDNRRWSLLLSGVFSMVSTPSSLYLLLSLLALLLCLRLLLCWLPLPLLWVCGSRVGLCSGGFFSWVGLASGSSAFLPSLFLCFRSSASVLCPLRIL